MPVNVVPMAMPQDPDEGRVGQEFGVGLSLPFGSWTSATPKGGFEIINPTGMSIPELKEMRKNSGQVRALIRLFTLPILSTLDTAKWVDPEGEESPEVEFANQMFELPGHAGGMTASLDRFMRETLLAVFEGFSVFEEVRQIPGRGPLKGKITLRKLAHRDASTVNIVVDENGGYNGFRQRATRAGGETVDIVLEPSKTWYYAANEEENPYYGVSFFETAFEHYTDARKIYYLMHIAAQLAAVPARKGIYPQNSTPTSRTAFKNALRDLGFNSSMTMPEGYVVETMDNKSSLDFLGLIDHHLGQMSKSVLGKFLDDEKRPVLIDSSISDPSVDMFVMGLQSIMTDIEQRMSNYLMPFYIDSNFGSERYPQFKFGQITDSTRDDVKSMLTTIASSTQTMWTTEFVRALEMRQSESLGFEIDYDEIAEREEAEKAEQEKTMAAQRDFLAQRGGGGAPEDGAGPAGMGGFEQPPEGAPEGPPPAGPPPGGDVPPEETA